MRRSLFYLSIFILLQFPILIKSLENFYVDDYELYGPTLAANDQFIVAIQNRTAISFSTVLDYATSSPSFCAVTYTPLNDSEWFATMLAVPRNNTGSTNGSLFVFVVHSTSNLTTYLCTVSVQFSPCQLDVLIETMMFNGSYPFYGVLGVNGNGSMAFFLANQKIFIQSLSPPYTTSNWASIWPLAPILLPVAIDLQDEWGVLGTYMRPVASPSKFRPYAYVVRFTDCFNITNPSCFIFQSPTLMNYYSNWQVQFAPPNSATTNSYNSLYQMSVSINDDNEVLIGVQSMNSVFRFRASSTSLTTIGYRFVSKVPSIGFGKGVGWLDSTTGAILMNNFTLDYIQWRSSNIELYPLTTANSFSSAIPPYASFPNVHQQRWSGLNIRFISILANPRSGSLIFMDYVGIIYVIRPSAKGYFVYTRNGIGERNNTIYIAPRLRCPSGTVKNISAEGKDLLRSCSLCSEGTYYSMNRSNGTNRCTPCDPEIHFCPWGAVAPLSLNVLDIKSQAEVYPESPETDSFEDLLLLTMFNMDFSANCLIKQPLFYAISIIGAGCLVLLLMGVLKLTHKCKKQRRTVKSMFKQTDLIGEGELWIGGVASFAIIVMAVFACLFSSDFIKQYPIEDSSGATFACDPTLRNAKFFTSMQSLGTPPLESVRPIFNMLNSQPFALNVEFLNTAFEEDDLSVSQVLGSILLNLPRVTNNTDGILNVSTNLTSHVTIIAFNLSGIASIGGFRIGLTGPEMKDKNYHVRAVDFSYAFNYSNRTATQDPIVKIQLIKLINSTAPLSNSGNDQYSALWIPTFLKNDDQLFYTEADFELYHVKDNTILTIEITEATYYILNTQEPIVKLTKAIFTDILFTTMCIELFALMFLFHKLAVSPVVTRVHNFVSPKKIRSKGVGSGKSGGGSSGAGCPHCQSIDSETLNTSRLPVQRAIQDAPMYPIRRQTSDIAKLHTISTPVDVFM